MKIPKLYVSTGYDSLGRRVVAVGGGFYWTFGRRTTAAQAAKFLALKGQKPIKDDGRTFQGKVHREYLVLKKG